MILYFHWLSMVGSCILKLPHQNLVCTQGRNNFPFLPKLQSPVGRVSLKPRMSNYAQRAGVGAFFHLAAAMIHSATDVLKFARLARYSPSFALGHPQRPRIELTAFWSHHCLWWCSFEHLRYLTTIKKTFKAESETLSPVLLSTQTTKFLQSLV